MFGIFCLVRFWEVAQPKDFIAQHGVPKCVQNCGGDAIHLTVCENPSKIQRL